MNAENFKVEESKLLTQVMLKQQAEFNSMRKQIKDLKIALMGVAFTCLGFYLVGFTSTQKKSIRLQEMIIEDSNGKPVMIMGAGVGSGKVKGRIRKDDLHGLVFIDSNGRDRLYLGKEGSLMMGGELVERDSEGWSLLINEPSGDERAGFGFQDENNAVGLGLDYGGKNGLEAIYLSASDSLAYITINGDVNKGHRDRIVLWSDTRKDVSMLKIGDSSKDDKIVLRSSKGKPSLYYKNEQQVKQDLIKKESN
ncbi:MAG: hypothetical protein EOO99_10945 [Pedobacter sp.]|nr:MAG: hypothetical protein EOO99_10945 [Pedobacter sp.]